MIAEGDEKLADFSDEKFPDSGDESDRIYQNTRSYDINRGGHGHQTSYYIKH